MDNGAPNFGMAFELVQGPDGKHLVQVTVLGGVMKASFAIPCTNGTDFLTQFGREFQTVLTEGKRLDRGLVTPQRRLLTADGMPVHGN